MPSYRSVAVTPIKRGGGRKAPSPTVAGNPADSLALQVALAHPARRVAALPVHRYVVGDRLRMTGGGQVVQRTASSCRVISLLPYEGRGPLQYRVRSEAEAFERIVAEADLTR
jgi:hypothetical protein